MEKLIKEPLVHFLVLGGFLFLLYSFLNPQSENTEDYTILFNDSDLNRLVSAYQKNWGYAPDSSTLENLIQEEIRSEIFYREALRMQLDHNDEIIRRRLRQKYAFLIKDISAEQEATEEELQIFYQQNAAKYRTQKLLSFNQYYFSPDKRKKPSSVIEGFLKQLKTNPQSTIKDDPSHLPRTLKAKDLSDIRPLFGQDFALRIFQETDTGWLGPIASGYGQHLVEITAIDTVQQVPFEEIKDQVISDWKDAKLEEFNTKLYQNLQSQYQVKYSLENWKNPN